MLFSRPLNPPTSIEPSSLIRNAPGSKPLSYFPKKPPPICWRLSVDEIDELKTSGFTFLRSELDKDNNHVSYFNVLAIKPIITAHDLFLFFKEKGKHVETECKSIGPPIIY